MYTTESGKGWPSQPFLCPLFAKTILAMKLCSVYATQIQLIYYFVVESCDSNIPSSSNITRIGRSSSMFMVHCSNGQNETLRCEAGSWTGEWQTVCLPPLIGIVIVI